MIDFNIIDSFDEEFQGLGKAEFLIFEAGFKAGLNAAKKAIRQNPERFGFRIIIHRNNDNDSVSSRPMSEVEKDVLDSLSGKMSRLEWFNAYKTKRPELKRKTVEVRFTRSIKNLCTKGFVTKLAPLVFEVSA